MDRREVRKESPLVPCPLAVGSLLESAVCTRRGLGPKSNPDATGNSYASVVTACVGATLAAPRLDPLTRSHDTRAPRPSRSGRIPAMKTSDRSNLETASASGIESYSARKGRSLASNARSSTRACSQISANVARRESEDPEIVTRWSASTEMRIASAPATAVHARPSAVASPTRQVTARAHRSARACRLSRCRVELDPFIIVRSSSLSCEIYPCSKHLPHGLLWPRRGRVALGHSARSRFSRASDRRDRDGGVQKLNVRRRSRSFLHGQAERTRRELVVVGLEDAGRYVERPSESGDRDQRLAKDSGVFIIEKAFRRACDEVRTARTETASDEVAGNRRVVDRVLERP